MHKWLQLTLVASSIGIILFLLIYFIHKCFSTRKQKSPDEPLHTPGIGIAKFQHVSSLHRLNHQNNARRTNNYYVFRRGGSTRPLFNWADNPLLITDAVENGWTRFAFSTYASSPSIKSRSLLGVCVSRTEGSEDMEAEISWEVSQGSADFVQKIRLNSGLSKKISTSSYSMGAISVIKTALPLPGPPLGNSSSFPQEAYFEITILSSDEDDGESVSKVKVGKAEGEKTKLIQENFHCAKTNSESLIHVTSSKVEEVKIGVNEEDRKGEVVGLSVGLSGGGSPPLKLPGSYAGSIGFNSNGSVYLDGIKLVLESVKEEWGRTETVIGCGYNPSQRKVFFTIDSELVHEIHCKSEEFGTPLYPTLAANTDIMVLVNFGQSTFKYAPANLQRTSNPCFIGPLANSPTLSYEDSKELFSMGRIDSQWLNRSTTRNTHNHGSVNKAVDFDEVSEGDLFEIVLDSSGRSPNTPLRDTNIGSKFFEERRAS